MNKKRGGKYCRHKEKKKEERKKGERKWERKEGKRRNLGKKEERKIKKRKKGRRVEERSVLWLIFHRNFSFEECFKTLFSCFLRCEVY